MVTKPKKANATKSKEVPLSLTALEAALAKVKDKNSKEARKIRASIRSLKKSSVKQVKGPVSKIKAKKAVVQDDDDDQAESEV